MIIVVVPKFLFIYFLQITSKSFICSTPQCQTFLTLSFDLSSPQNNQQNNQHKKYQRNQCETNNTKSQEPKYKQQLSLSPITMLEKTSK